jgi:hypothetical protein
MLRHGLFLRKKKPTEVGSRVLVQNGFAQGANLRAGEALHTAPQDWITTRSTKHQYENDRESRRRRLFSVC